MQDKRFFKTSIAFSLLIILILVISFGFSSCQLVDLDSGSEQITFDNVTFIDGETVLTPDGHPNPDVFRPVKEGHIFRYWVFKKNNVSTMFKTENYDGTPITLYAVWKANEYVVKFLDSDGTVLKVNGKDEQKVKHGTSAISPETPEKYGYNFVGWDRAFDSVTQDLTVTAKFERIELFVNFLLGDEILVQKSVYMGDKITNAEKEALNSLSAFTSHGLTLEGWYSDPSFRNKVKISDVKISEETNLYAKLIPSKIQKLNVFTESENNTFVYSESLKVIVNCTYTSHNVLTYKTVWSLDGEVLSGEEKNQISLSNLSLGTHTVKAEITATYGDYSDTETKTVEIIVTRKGLDVIADSLTITYGDETPRFTYSVSSGDGIGLGQATFSCSYKPGDPKGTYPITISGLSSEIYDLNFFEGTLTVLPKNIQVKVDDAKISYGEDAPEFKFTSIGILEGDTLTAGEYTCDYRKGMSVGKYDISLSGLENPNYIITDYINGVLSVEKMKLQIKVESKSKVYYGDPKPEFGYKIYKGFVLENDSLGTPKYLCDYTEGAKAQRYTINLVGLSNPNYEIQPDMGWLIVYPKEIQVDWIIESKYVYNGFDQSGTVRAVYTDIHGETLELTPKFELQGKEAIFADAGEYSVSVILNDSNYKLLNSVKALNMNKRPITIEVHDKTVMYGDDIPEYTYTVLGIMGEDNLGKVEFNCAYTKGSKTGTYQLKAVGSENPNYEISYNNAMLTVLKRAVNVEWSIGSSYTYNGKVQSDTINALFKKYDGKNTVMTLTYYLSDKVAGFKNAGTYRVVASTEDTNYELHDAEKIITIDPKPLIFTLSDKTITYGDTSPIFTFSTEGLVNGEGESVLGKPQYICDYVQGKDAGQFEISCKPLTNGNYSITYVNATLTVNKMTVEAIWSFEDSYTYNGRSQADTISVKIRGYAGDYLPMNVAFVSGENNDFYHAGVYTVTAYGDAEKNYIVNHSERTFEILPKKAILSAISKTIAYGDMLPELSYKANGLEGDDDLGKMSYECAYHQGSPSSGYAITITPFLCNDYDLSYESATLNVINRIVDIVWDNLDSYTYNKTNQAETVIAKFLGYSGEYEIAELTFELNGRESDFVYAGTYSVTATHFDKNYTLLNDAKTLLMNKKAVSVIPNPLTITYGDDVPTYAYTVAGLEENDSLSGERYTCAYAKGSEVGTYTLSIYIDEQQNYEADVSSSVVTVEPLTVSVAWNYGKLTYNGLTQNDSVSAEFITYEGKAQSVNLLFTQNGENVLFKNAGDYLAKVDYENKNYLLTNVELETSISQKDIVVEIQNKNANFGNDVVFTHSISGLAENENESVLGTINYLCNYEIGSPIGSYSINASGLMNPNYTIVYKSAVLTIEKRNVEAVWVSKSNYVYNGSEQINTVSVSYKSYTGESVPMNITISSGNSTFRNAGEYVFLAKNEDENYSVSGLSKRIIINKANYQNITHNALIGTYNPDLTLESYILSTGYRWADESILPTVKQTEYKALYNADSENYNDFELYVKLTLSKADYKNITHKPLSGVYNEGKTLASYALLTGFVWNDKAIVPTVDKTEYQATYNLDKDNYNDFALTIELNLEKGNYSGITHKAFSGQYSPSENLSRFSLDKNYSWKDESIIPTVNVTKYKAVYNRDNINYNDYTLDITVVLSKAVYKASEVPAHLSLGGTYDPNGKLSDYELNDGFRWKNPNLQPCVTTTSYEALYNLDTVNYEDFALTITLLLAKSNYSHITHKVLSGTYNPKKFLSSYTLDLGFSWVDRNIIPTVDVTSYKAIFNGDPDNFNDFELWVTLNLKKANYTSVTHTPLVGEYDPNRTLNDYPLNENFRWADGSEVPSSEKTQYQAFYNADPVNYNDKSLWITVNVSKVDYNGEIPNQTELTATYDPKKTLAEYELPEGFRWRDPTFTPSLGRDEYEVYYNPNPYGYNDVLTTIVLITVNEK